jgi:hypothetical protein
VAVETAQEAQDVVFGMFLVNSAPASVLFDSGASHTFISAEYVAKYSITLCTMPSSMLVNSPGGNMRAVYRCLGVKIQIMGKEFYANPIVLPSSGIDIILGFIVPSDQWFSPAQKVKGSSSLQPSRQQQIVQ